MGLESKKQARNFLITSRGFSVTSHKWICRKVIGNMRQSPIQSSNWHCMVKISCKDSTQWWRCLLRIHTNILQCSKFHKLNTSTTNFYILTKYIFTKCTYSYLTTLMDHLLAKLLAKAKNANIYFTVSILQVSNKVYNWTTLTMSALSHLCCLKHGSTQLLS